MKYAPNKPAHSMRPFLFSALLLLALAAVMALDSVIMEPQDVAALPGAVNVSVPILMTNDVPVAVFEFEVNHPSYMTFKHVTNTSRMTDSIIEAKAQNSTHVKVAAFVPGNISTGSGAIMNLYFDVDGLAIPGLYTLEIKKTLLTNVNASGLNVTAETGVFNIL